MKTKILTILKSGDGFVSGQQLCDGLGVSRTAVWKVINQLKDEGYGIDAVKNKGYRLELCPDVLTSENLVSSLAVAGCHNPVVSREVVDSTNNLAKKLAEEGAEHGTLVVSEQQTGGKGRRGRSWVSPPGTGIWMTYILRPSISPTKASMLTIVAAMAVLDAVTGELERLGKNCECGIKWPNDIVLNGRKVVGILTEMSAEPELVNYVVVGIGINVNTTDFPDDIKDTASSIYRETGARLSRSRVIAGITKALVGYYGIFMETGDLSGLVQEYNKMLINAGRQVRIMEPGNERVGTAIGIGSDGELIVTLEDGRQEKVMSGEVSVRGLYGYV